MCSLFVGRKALARLITLATEPNARTLMKGMARPCKMYLEARTYNSAVFFCMAVAGVLGAAATLMSQFGFAGEGRAFFLLGVQAADQVGQKRCACQSPCRLWMEFWAACSRSHLARSISGHIAYCRKMMCSVWLDRCASLLVAFGNISFTRVLKLWCRVTRVTLLTDIPVSSEISDEVRTCACDLRHLMLATVSCTCATAADVRIIWTCCHRLPATF